MGNGKRRVAHIFLGGGEQWCSNIVNYYRTANDKAVRRFEHLFISSPCDFSNDPKVIHDERICFDDGKRAHSLAFLYDYASEVDWVFLYNNRLTVLDRACVKRKVLKKIVWFSFGSDIDLENESGWHGSNFLSKIYHATVLPVVEAQAKRKMGAVRAICIQAVYDGFSIRRDYGDVPLLPFSFLKNREKSVLPMSNCSYKKDGILRILVGHHGYPGVSHRRVLEALLRYKNENILIYLPMAYGDRSYIQQVKKYARDCFSDKAIIIDEPMNFEDYASFLSTIDVAIFDTDKNVAVDNIALLCHFGKKIYSRTTGRIAERLSFESIRVYDVDSIKTEPFGTFSEPSQSAEAEKAYAKAAYSGFDIRSQRLSVMLSRIDEISL